MSVVLVLLLRFCFLLCVRVVDLDLLGRSRIKSFAVQPFIVKIPERLLLLLRQGQ